VSATVHPSSIIRSPDDETRHLARRDFTEDLGVVAGEISARRAGQAA
jgi:hypothetical protein